MLTEHGLYLRERYIASVTELGRPVLKDFVMRFHLAVAALAVRRASLLCPASDFNARWQLALGADPAKVSTLYNGVDVSEFPARTADVGRPDVVWLGRIDPLKDLHTLIRSADLVRRDIPSVQYRLFGEEPRSSRGYLASCQSLVRELDLESTVCFEGRSPTSAEAFYAGQFSILSSISEGFPYSVLESMSCGVPVVATSVGGVPEAVADTGYLVPPRDPGSMAQACRRMLASDARRRRLGAAARRARRAAVRHRADAEPSRSALPELGARPGPRGMTAEPVPAATSNWVQVGAHRAAGPAPQADKVWKPAPRKRKGKRPKRAAPRPAGDFDALRRTFEAKVQHSVDAFEVAVVLEAEGINDAEAERYGARDVFELARRLRTAVATAPADRVAPPPRTDWYPSPSISIFRGFTFTVGALTVMTVVGLGAGTGAAALVLFMNVFGVAVMQAVSFLSYMLLERSGAIRDPSVIRPLLWVLALPLLVAIVTAIVMGPMTGVFAGAALTYLIGMFMVLVLGRPVLVAVIVLPVAVTATVDSLQPAHFITVLAVGLWMVGAAVLVTASFVLTRPEGRRVAIRLGPVDFRAALPFAAASLTAGIVVIANLLMVSGSQPLRHGGTRTWLIASLPFLIPVSFAEVLVVGVRRPLHQAVGTTGSPTDFRSLGRRSSVRMWALHAFGAAAVLAVVVPLLANGTLEARLLLGLSFLLIGTLLTATLLIASGDAIRYEQWLLGVTAVLLIAARLTMSTPGSTQRLAVNVVILAAAAVAGVILSVRVTGTFARYR